VRAARVAVVQFPGVNCESESVLALSRVGLEPEIFRWTRPAGELHDYQAFVLPGGFAYQDRVRAGALAAKHPMMEVLAEEVERGKPVLGICNGAQALVESGLVPGSGTVELALARNRMTGRSGYFNRWITTRDPARLTALARAGLAPLRYAGADGRLARRFPDNPNGSRGAIAAMCNSRGNVLAMMPHPERAQDAGAVARGVTGAWAERRRAAADAPDGLSGGGPGLLLFEGLARHLERA